MPQKWPYHRMAELFPLVEGQAFEDMALDVELHGIRDEIILWKDPSDRITYIIEGRNRYRCWEWCEQRRVARAARTALEAKATAKHCATVRVKLADAVIKAKSGRDGDKKALAEVEAEMRLAQKALDRAITDADAAAKARPLQLPTLEWDGKPADLVGFVFSKNLFRRHLSESQRAFFVVKATELDEELREQRESAARRAKAGLKSGPTPLVSRDTSGQNASKQRFRAAAAKRAGVSSATVARAQKVQKTGVKQLGEAVADGRLSVNRAAEIAKLTPAQQLAAIRAEGDKAERAVQEADLADATARWAKTLTKVARQMAASIPPLPRTAKEVLRAIATMEREAAEVEADRPKAA